MPKCVHNFLGWLLVVTLVAGCIPAAVPVGTLDPNAISTYIIQTAAAASTQTAVAVPLLAPTSTFAPTLAAEATFTNVPAINFPSPTSEPEIQYFRIKHDHQLEEYNFRSRTADPKWDNGRYGLQTPEVFKLTTKWDTASTNLTVINNFWEKYIDKLNYNDPKKILYVKADNTALFDMGFPNMKSLTMGGNLITLYEISSGWGRVRMLDFNYPGPLEEVNYATRPDLIHKFVIVGWNRNKQITYLTDPPPPYGDLYYPMLSTLPVWIPMRLLEPFPFLPLEITANATQPIMKEPSKDSLETGLEFIEGETATLVDYYPTGSNVWGRLSNGGWIALLLYESQGVEYLTTWKMDTQPPLPPPPPPKK